MRTANFANYNLRDSRFVDANLYRSNFYQSTLIGADFSGADLYGANLTHTNLTGAKLGSGTNLRGADFRNAKLDGVDFGGAEHLEDALFSFGALLKADQPPFSTLANEVHIELLARHVEKLRGAREDDARIERLLKKLGLDDLAALLERIEAVPDPG